MKRLLTLIAAACLLAACATTPAPFVYSAPAQFEGSSGYTAKPGWATKKFAVAAANPLATDAGLQVLRAGGSAIDAAVAVQMVLALVEPQSSGIGGGAFMLHASGNKVEAFDGRETAPAGVDEKLFIGADGKPMAFFDGVVGGRAVGVPGVVKMLEVAHKQHGKLPWAQLFIPAIALAESGFKVSPRLAMQLKSDAHLKKDPAAAAYYFKPDGSSLAAGELLKNPALADVLRQIASKGAGAMHEGSIAQAMVNKVQGHPTNPGKLAMSDLAGYQVKKRDPICSDYSAAHSTYLLCGMPPPSSGAIAVGQILGLLANTNAATLPPVAGMSGVAGSVMGSGQTPSAEWLHLYTEASRLAFADRGQYLGDPDFVTAPDGNWMSLLNTAYLADRAKLIAQQPGGQSMKTAKPGIPGPARTAYAPMPDQPEYGTSHISIIDAFGNAIAMTSTVEDAFGSRQLTDGGTGKAGGFFLNNQLTDFSFAPTDAEGILSANRVQPGKRPRSSMAPTLVFDKATGQVVMTGGSMGGALIIHHTAKLLYGTLNWGLNAQQAIDLPNFGSLNGPSLLEENRFSPATVKALKARGAEVREMNMNSGLQAIQKTDKGFFGGADPRREGIVLGD